MITSISFFTSFFCPPVYGNQHPEKTTPRCTVSIGVSISPSTLAVSSNLTSSSATIFPMTVPATTTFLACIFVLTFPVSPTTSSSSVLISPSNFPSIRSEPLI
jgi:hypothetical protein